MAFLNDFFNFEFSSDFRLTKWFWNSDFFEVALLATLAFSFTRISNYSSTYIPWLGSNRRNFWLVVVPLPVRLLLGFVGRSEWATQNWDSRSMYRLENSLASFASQRWKPSNSPLPRKFLPPASSVPFQCSTKTVFQYQNQEELSLSFNSAIRKLGISRVAFCPVLGVTMPLEIPLLR